MDEKGCEKRCRWHRRAQSRPEEILLATLDVLTEKGYRNTRLEDVAARAGVTKPLIYHYFEDKAHLVHRAMDWRLRQVVSAMREELSLSGGTWEERIRDLCRWQWARWTDPAWGAFLHGVVAELREDAPDIQREWLRTSFQERCSMVEEILAGAGDEIRRGVDPARAARFLVGGLWQMGFFQHIQGAASPLSAGDLDAMLESALDIFLAGVRRESEER